jgi:hypothetical protein
MRHWWANLQDMWICLDNLRGVLEVAKLGEKKFAKEPSLKRIRGLPTHGSTKEKNIMKKKLKLNTHAEEKPSYDGTDFDDTFDQDALEHESTTGLDGNVYNDSELNLRAAMLAQGITLLGELNRVSTDKGVQPTTSTTSNTDRNAKPINRTTTKNSKTGTTRKEHEPSSVPVAP